MANKNPHKMLQRLTEDEIGKRPKLSYCLRLVQSNPRTPEETKEQWLSRVFLLNKEALIKSAVQKADE